MRDDPRRPPVSLALAFLLLLVVLLLAASTRCAAAAATDPGVRCSRSCVAENCNSVGIRYGKFCGVGWTGCPGEKPCDELDACCKAHDECVEKKGLMSVKCHEKFKSCMRKVKKSGKAGFSKECPYETAMPTMVQGMDMAILFSQLGGQHTEL
ncbi:probable phospholipase A2 homolog 1 [Elaeis guineensis]|uniref:phospholipase A2 n=1 Tax=Elaeis guineensis var. tenera TaxID=51953 RepID=A0A6I9SBE7_ELAGV|nr:probable phospholipase A2 homolog 1 [Elaeis guineensis]